MSISVESAYSTQAQTKENVRVDSLIPSLILERAETLKELLQDYYSYLNEPKTLNNLGEVTEKAKPSHEIASIMAARDIDTGDYEYLDQIQKEIAASVPKSAATDRVTLYKNLIRYYSVRGSEDSIELFFKIVFNDNVEVYYPYKDVLIPSSGTWDKEGRSSIDVPQFDQGLAVTFQAIVTDPNDVWNVGEIIYGGYGSGASGAFARVLSQDGYIVTLTDISKDINGDAINFIKGETAIGETTIEFDPFITGETVTGLGAAAGTTGTIDTIVTTSAGVDQSTATSIVLSGVTTSSGSSGFVAGEKISTIGSGGSGNVRTILTADNRVQLGLNSFSITDNVTQEVPSGETSALGIITDVTPTRISLDYDAGSVSNNRVFTKGRFLIGGTGSLTKLLVGGVEPFWELITTTSSATTGTNFTLGETVTITQDSKVIDVGRVLHWDGTMLEIRTVSGGLSISTASGAGLTFIEGETSGTTRIISSYERFTDDIEHYYEMTMESGSGLDTYTVGDLITGADSGAFGTISNIAGNLITVDRVTGFFRTNEDVWIGKYPSAAPRAIVSIDNKSAIIPIKTFEYGEKVYGSVSGATGYVVDDGDPLNPSLNNVDGTFTTSDVLISYRYGFEMDVASVTPTLALTLNNFEVGETINTVGTGSSGVEAKVTHVSGWSIRVQYCDIDPANYVVGESLIGATSDCESVINTVTLGYSKTLLGFYVDGEKKFNLSYKDATSIFPAGEVIRLTISGTFAKILSQVTTREVENDYVITVDFASGGDSYTVGDFLTGAESGAYGEITDISTGGQVTIEGVVDGTFIVGEDLWVGPAKSTSPSASPNSIASIDTKTLIVHDGYFVCTNPTGFFPPNDLIYQYDAGSGSGTATVVSAYNDGVYLDTKGFPSNIIKIQDSYFYQQFSYVIQTGKNITDWKDVFNRLVHPSGFIFFGEILILIEGINIFTVDPDDFEGQDAQRINSSMQTIQPGLVSDEDIPLKIIISPLGGSNLVDVSYTGASGGTFTIGEFVTDSVSGATGEVVEVLGTTNGVLRIQSPNGRFLVGSTLTQTYGSGPVTVTATVESEFVITSNRTFYGDIQRTADKEIDGFEVQDTALANPETDLTMAMEVTSSSSLYGANQLKYYDTTPIELYSGMTIEDAAAGDYPWNDYTFNDVAFELSVSTSSSTTGTNFTIGEEFELVTGATLVETGRVVAQETTTGGTILRVLTDSGLFRYVPGVSIIEGMTSGTTRLVDNSINNPPTWNGANLTVTLV